MIKKIFIILSFLFIFSNLQADKVNKIIIEGNKRIADETIKIYGDIKLDKDFNENEINKVLNNLYSSNFFENIEINLVDNVLKIKVESIHL